MTGRELAAAVRPLEAGAKAILRLAELAHEAIRLEEGIASAQRRLTELTGSVTTSTAELARLQTEARTLAVRLDADRQASLAATETEQRAVIGAARAVVEAHERSATEWRDKAAAAKAAHDATVATLRAEETALRTHVAGLRDLARRMAQAAEAVPR